MALKLADKWLWDFWFARDGPDFHIFYLQAPRELQKEELRHWHVSIGHAVSQDLRTWDVLPDALYPGAGGAEKSDRQETVWDDYTTWTGSIVRHNGTWHLFYTGTSKVEKGLIQRIGLATSADLLRWEKHSQNPLISADPRWYETLTSDHWHDEAWRDPYVIWHPDDGAFHAFITARANVGSADGRGVIAHARSHDLIHWEVLPPVSAPGEFGQLEVPQWVELQGRYYLLFCTTTPFYSAERRRRPDVKLVNGTHYLVSDSPFGPFNLSTDEFLAGDAIGSLYAGKVVRGPDANWHFMAWRMFAPDGTFIGELSDPMPLSVNSDGNLSVAWQPG